MKIFVDGKEQSTTSVTLDASDIQIGSVELKNATTDDRASIVAANTARTTATVVVASQHIDATGKVQPAGEVAGNGVFTKHSITGIGDGRQTVTNAGTAVALAGSTTISEVTITSETNNTDLIVVGGSTVVAALATRRGVPLSPGDSITIRGDDLADIYIDSLVNTEGVSYLYLT